MKPITLFQTIYDQINNDAPQSYTQAFIPYSLYVVMPVVAQLLVIKDNNIIKVESTVKSNAIVMN